MIFITLYIDIYISFKQKDGSWGEAINMGDKVNFSVPTGNFGNILAGYYAKMLGLPIKKLICGNVNAKW